MWVQCSQVAESLWSSLAILSGTKPVNALTCQLPRSILLCSLFIDLVCGNLVLNLLACTSDFHCFWALGVGLGALTLPYVLSWGMGLIVAFCKAFSNSDRKESLGHLKNSCPHWGYLNTHLAYPPGCSILINRSAYIEQNESIHKPWEWWLNWISRARLVALRYQEACCCQHQLPPIKNRLCLCLPIRPAK